MGNRLIPKENANVMTLLGGLTDRPTDGPTDIQTHAPIDLSHYDTCKRILLPSFQTHAPIDLSHYDTIVKGYFCRRSSTGSISQSECSDFGYGPITAAMPRDVGGN